MSALTRRTMLTGAAATTAATAVGAATTSWPAAAADAATPMKLFIGLSSALTGIAEKKLAPDRDVLNVKQAYFDAAASHGAFDGLLKVYAAHQANPNKDEIAKVILEQSGSDIRYLARSIMLAWYLGAWYEPAELQKPRPTTFKIISPAAYTQGWVWRVAQAHPMGYSEWAFGYWQNDPVVTLDAFIG
jgi:hypothetical protein